MRFEKNSKTQGRRKENNSGEAIVGGGGGGGGEHVPIPLPLT